MTVTCLDFADFITRIDHARALFYLDPPYFGCEGDYGAGLFDRARFTDMAAQLATIEGRFILSLNDKPEVREIFAAFEMVAVSTCYTIASAGASEQGELLISNWRLPRGAIKGGLEE